MPIHAPDSERAEHTETFLPPRDKGTLQPLTDFLRSHAAGAELVSPDGQTRIPLPLEAYEALRDIAEALIQGQAIQVTALSQRLTTSQAASILGVSRPTLIRLLEDRKIPYEQPRRHRMIRLDDVIAYQRRRHAELNAALDEMTSQAVADGLYDVPAGDYQEALSRAKRVED